ncbi:MAG: hypothetical protein B1H03_04255 [Planctomycetales bacterium 4484_113]|nr:MAG: hypothetical protein B1H03_04255 [Planctomycetales bacterium 4484_113]
MRELRKDPIISRWVIISSERGRRPKENQREDEDATVVESTEDCPFEMGRESSTPPEVYAIRERGTAPDTPGWQVRVTPNKYPALSPEGEPTLHEHGLFVSINGVGIHEMVIETPDHSRQLDAQPVERIALILGVYQQRIRTLRQDPRVAHVLVFRNQGTGAGASLHHPHSQIVATPIIPNRIEQELGGSLTYWQRTGHCIYCDLTEQVRRESEFVVHQRDGVLAFCPYASIFPYEVWIVPEEHAADFADADDRLLVVVARVLKTVLLKQREALGEFSYNLVLHTVPAPQAVEREFPSASTHYHWHIELYPRLTKPAGCEWGAGVFINPVPPEEAARHLRKLDVAAAMAGDANAREHPDSSPTNE